MADLLSSTFPVGADKYTIDRYASRTGPAKRPVIVILHGVDGMVDESDTEVRRLADQIADDEYVVFVPHYLEPAPGSTTMPPEEVLVQRTLQVNGYRPRVTAAVDYALAQGEVDATRLGLVGLSLGGGLALWYAESAPRRSLKAVVDFFGHIGERGIYANAGKLPPTLVFHNAGDGIVGRANSDDLIKELAANRVVHDSEIYDEQYPKRKHHTFRPGDKADIDSRARTRKWLDTYVKS